MRDAGREESERVASLADVAARLKTVLEKTDQSAVALRTAGDLAQEAADRFGAAGVGSAHEYEFSQVVGRWTDAVEGTSALLALVSTIRAQIEQLLRVLVAEGPRHKPMNDQPAKPPQASTAPPP